ncbi:outer membrane beta-barrel protein [candidate division KSB1 bacterium]|nr:outer membrane beta-barrel protein [candidate division KSB1 bacterium]
MKLSIIILFPLLLHAQWVEDTYRPQVQPRAMFGAKASYFRISLHNFEDIYTNKWGESFGAFAGIRAFGAHYVMVKYGNFQQNGKSGTHAPSGQDLKNARWNEHWYKIGLRIHPPIEQKWGSYYGFGIGFYDVQEVEPISIFRTVGEQNDSDQAMGTGFYLELGIDYLMMQKLATFFQVEISSGGSRGRSGFEALSVGGWLFSLGVIFWPF